MSKLNTRKPERIISANRRKWLMPPISITCTLMLLLLVSTSARAQFYWQRNEKAKAVDMGADVIADAYGNTYVIGSFQEKIAFDPAGANYQLGSEGEYDVFIAKYGPNGNYLWGMHGWNKGNAFGEGVTIDKTGENIYITGTFTDTLHIGSWSNYVVSSGSSDAFFAKINVSGATPALQWLQKGGGDLEDKGLGVDYDNTNGALYATGYFTDKAAFGSNWTVSSAGGKDIYVAVLQGSNGSFNWAMAQGGKGDDAGHGIAADENHGITVTGYFTGQAFFGNAGKSATLLSKGEKDIFFLRLGDNRGLRWVVRAGGWNDDVGYSIQSDKGASLYATGFHMDSAKFGDSFLFNSEKNKDIYVARLDTAKGAFTWVFSSGGKGEDEGRCITTDKEGNSYVTGYFSGSATFNGSGSSPSLSGFGQTDIFVAKYDKNGKLICLQQGGAGEAGDAGQGITHDNRGIAYLTGFFGKTAKFGSYSTAQSLTSSGMSDMFVAKYSCDSNQIPPATYCNAQSCKVDSIILNTGYDQINQQLYPTGTWDPYWILVNAPPPSGNGTYNLNTPAYNIVRNSAWADARTDWQANYISAYTTAGSNANNWFNSNKAGYRFERCFCVCDGIDKISLSLKILADNGAEVFLDGVSIGISSGSSTTNFNNSSTPAISILDEEFSLEPGVHCIAIDLRNDHDKTAMGLAVWGSMKPVSSGAPLMISPACCNDVGMVMGRKIHDIDCNGVADPGEPGLSGWDITLTNLSTGLDTSLTTDNDGYYYFIGLSAGMYSIKEDQQNGWTATEPLDSFVFALEKNATKTVNFLNCKSEPTNCGLEFAELEHDSICCGYSFRLVNPIAGSPAITAVSYSVTGGVVDAITTLGCTPASTTIIPGSTSGTLTFTACNTNIDFNVAATATNASGIITMTIITEHGAGAKCTTEVSFKCPRQELISCSELLLTQVYDNPAISNITNREFEIHNLKNPMAEISHIVLTPINIAGPLIGIDPKFKMINSQTTWTEMDPVSGYWVGPYVLLPNTPTNSTFCSGTHTSVQVNHSGILLFTIGHDATGGNYWNGGLRVDIIHCDGDTCTDSVMWNTVQLSGMIGITKSVKPAPKLTASSLLLANPGNLGTNLISTIQVVSKTPQSSFFAVSGGYLFALDKSLSDKVRVSSSMVNPKTAVFHLSKPVSASDFSKLDSINIVLTYAIGIDPQLEVIYFDENNNKIGVDKASVALYAVTAVQQVPLLKIVSASPNPARDKMTIRYGVNTRQGIVMDVLNSQGTVVMELVRDQVNGGEHAVVLDATTLSAGTYILRLTGESEVATLPIVIIH